MSWRTVIISNHCKLDYKMGYLVIRREETNRILLSEIETLVIENPAVSITGVLLQELTENKTKVIFCDYRRNPSSELIPHHGCVNSTAKLRLQLNWDNDIKAAVWREIVCEKIEQQAGLLTEKGKTEEAELLESYIERVQPADASNKEAHAAKVYFNALFGKDFIREADNATNSALNYGYSMVMSAFSREISANGYLTQLGIFHGSTYNPFNLASDIMEPFRVVVDRYVVTMNPEEFSSDEKHALWDIAYTTFKIDGAVQTFSNAVKLYAKGIFDALNYRDLSCIRHFSFVERT